MEKVVVTLCGILLMAVARADGSQPVSQTLRDEVNQAVKDGMATNIFIGNNAVLSAPRNTFEVSAKIFAYKFGGRDNHPFGRTILTGDDKSPAHVTLPGRKSDEPLEITAPEIEVETALTEVLIESDGTAMPSEVPWKDLVDALKAAPESPRFKIRWSMSALSAHESFILIYDRRSRKLYQAESTWQMDTKPSFTQSTEKNVTDEDIKSRVPSYQKDEENINK